MTIEVFIKKPEKVEVLQYDGTNYDEVVKFAGEEFQRIKGCFVKGDYIIKSDKYKIVARSIKPDFAKQELIGSYTKDAVQGVKPNVHMSLEKLQKFFEVPIVSEQKKDDDKVTSNVDKITSNNCDVKKYREKPVVVEAVQNTGKNVFEIGKFSDGKCRPVYTPNGYKFSVNTLEGTMEANIGDYIIKGVKGEFYPCKPDVFEATYDEYNKQRDGNHTSKPSSFSLRDLVMQIAPKHIRYYIKRLEEYGFKLAGLINANITIEKLYFPFTVLENKRGDQVCIVDKDGRISDGGTRRAFELILSGKSGPTGDYAAKVKIEVDNNNWLEAFNELVASFPDEIMKNTNHHASLTL